MSPRIWAPGLAVDVVDDLEGALRLSVEWDALADRCGAGPLMRPQHALGCGDTWGGGGCSS